MAPLPMILKTNRCVFHWASGTGQTAVNVMHFRSTAEDLSPVAVNYLLQTYVTRAMWEGVSQAGVIASIDVTPLNGSAATNSFVTDGSTRWQGPQGLDFTPQGAVLLKLQTALRGRSNRGRIYLPYLAESAGTGGSLTAGVIASSTSAWEIFRSTIQAAGLELVVASYKLATAQSVITIQTEPFIGTQRRRQQRNRG